MKTRNNHYSALTLELRRRDHSLHLQALDKVQSALELQPDTARTKILKLKRKSYVDHQR